MGAQCSPKCQWVRWVCFCKVTEKVFTYCKEFTVRKRNKTSIETDGERSPGLLHFSGSKTKSHVPQKAARVPSHTRTYFRKETSTDLSVCPTMQWVTGISSVNTLMRTMPPAVGQQWETAYWQWPLKGNNTLALQIIMLIAHKQSSHRADWLFSHINYCEIHHKVICHQHTFSIGVTAVKI